MIKSISVISSNENRITALSNRTRDKSWRLYATSPTPLSLECRMSTEWHNADNVSSLKSLTHIPYISVRLRRKSVCEYDLPYKSAALSPKFACMYMHAILVAQTTSIYRVYHRLARYQSFETLRHGNEKFETLRRQLRNMLRTPVLAQSQETARILFFFISFSKFRYYLYLYYS